MSLDLASALALGGRDAAFAEIMRRHRDPLYRLVRGHVGDAEEALDLVQESFLAAHQAPGRCSVSAPGSEW